jgi:hypothetical protein
MDTLGGEASLGGKTAAEEKRHGEERHDHRTQ